MVRGIIPRWGDNPTYQGNLLVKKGNFAEPAGILDWSGLWQCLAGEAVVVGVEAMDVAAGLSEAVLEDGLGLGLEVSAVVGVGGAVVGRRGWGLFLG